MTTPTSPQLYHPVVGCSVFALASLIVLTLVQDSHAQRTFSDFRANRVARRTTDAESYSNRPWRTMLQEEEIARPALEPANKVDSNQEDEQDEARQKDLRTTPHWPAKPITSIRLSLDSNGLRIPEDRSTAVMATTGSVWEGKSPKLFAWAAPNIRYQPLYFEDVALERYGQTLPPYQQTVASGFHFFKSAVFLPNQMLHDGPQSCDYPLGFCRPGNTIPYTVERKFFGIPR